MTAVAGGGAGAPAAAPALTAVPGNAPAVAPGGALELITERARAGAYGPDPAEQRIALAFTTAQAVRHPGRARGYRNEVLGLRLGAAVGSCAVEPGELPADALTDSVGATVDDLLGHPLTPVRVAALDAYLMHCRPHTPAHGARPVTVPAGGSLQKSRARARAVAGLLPLAAVRRVLVVGVVNSCWSSSVRVESSTFRATSRVAPPSGASRWRPTPAPGWTTATRSSPPA